MLLCTFALTHARTWGDALPPDSFSCMHATFFFAIDVWFFYIAYFLTFLHKACKWQLFMTFRWLCSQGHVTAYLTQMLNAVDLFSCFSKSMINLAIHVDSNGYSNKSSTTAERWPPYRSYDVIMYDIITGYKNISGNNYSRNRDRAVGEVTLCLYCQDSSNDISYFIQSI